MISAFTSEKEITSSGFTYFPKTLSMDGMNAVLRYGAQLRQSYLITISVTVIGTFLGLLIMSMFAYSISRKDFSLRKFLSIYLLIPMLFSGGQLSNYIFFTTYYGLKNTLWVMIIPLCVSTMNVIILRTYIHSAIPDELMEAAKIDGAGEYRTFFQITLPLMKPSLAAVGFMMATAYWNDWQNAYLFVDKSYLLRTFKEVKGYTLLEFHNLTRCEKAKELLNAPSKKKMTCTVFPQRNGVYCIRSRGGMSVA